MNQKSKKYQKKKTQSIFFNVTLKWQRIEMKIKIQSREWFEKNAYYNADNEEWWINERHESTFFDIDGSVPYYIDSFEVGEVMDIADNTYESYKWAVEKILTKEENPEYFL